MVVERQRSVCDGLTLRWLIAAGRVWLHRHQSQVNAMNVFPVPDGDTGTNMFFTLDRAYQAIEASDDAHVGRVSAALARGALRGARGNSGTILSMLLRGFAHALDDHDAFDGPLFVTACQAAVRNAYDTVSTVMEPVEGTMLTVAREAADALAERAQPEDDLCHLLDLLLSEARASLERTPQLLATLRQAGVVDSGGMGLVYILEGMQRLLAGEDIAEDANDALQAAPTGDPNEMNWQNALAPDDEQGYGYDVQFLMIGEGLDVHQVRADIGAMGWSPLVDGDDSLIKVHVHVHDPGQPLSYAIAQGVELDDIVVENMQAQYRQYVSERSERESGRQAAAQVAVITVARGDGLERLFKEYHATRILVGGQTVNPSTEDFLDAIASVDADEVILLPNNGNVILAAEQAAALAHDKSVRVVPSRNVPQGINALLAYGGDLYGQAELDQVYEHMLASLDHVLCLEITQANKSGHFNGIEYAENQYIGLINGDLRAAADEIPPVMRALLDQARGDEHEIATVYYGKNVNRTEAQALLDQLAERYDALEFELVYGGQPLYPYILSLE